MWVKKLSLVFSSMLCGVTVNARPVFFFFPLPSLGDISASVTSKFVDFQHLKTSFYPMYSVCESRKL